MRLPQPLFEAVRRAMAHHGHWHLARTPRAWIPTADRPEWEEAHAHFPDLIPINQVGAGAEFLTFHRTMIRQFKWLIDNTPGHFFVYKPWPRIPDELVTALPPSMFSRAHARILELIRQGTLDQLGSYLERTATDFTAGSNLHTALHGIIDARETRMGASARDQRECGMADLTVAHCNEQFWGLHGWIDDIYALWEYAHKQIPNQEPLEPGGHGLVPSMDMTDARPEVVVKSAVEQPRHQH